MFRKKMVIVIVLLQSIMFFQCAKNNIGEEGRNLSFNYGSNTDSIKGLSSVHTAYHFQESYMDENKLAITFLLGNFSKESKTYHMDGFQLVDKKGGTSKCQRNEIDNFFTIDASSWREITVPFQLERETDIRNLKLVYQDDNKPSYEILLKPKSQSFDKPSFFDANNLDGNTVMGKSRKEIIKMYGYPDHVDRVNGFIEYEYDLLPKADFIKFAFNESDQVRVVCLTTYYENASDAVYNYKHLTASKTAQNIKIEKAASLTSQFKYATYTQNVSVLSTDNRRTAFVNILMN